MSLRWFAIMSLMYTWAGCHTSSASVVALESALAMELNCALSQLKCVNKDIAMTTAEGRGGGYRRNEGILKPRLPPFGGSDSASARVRGLGCSRTGT